MCTAPEQRQPEPKQRKVEPERGQKPRKALTMACDAETSDRGAGRAADALGGAVLRGLGGIADFFAEGSTEPECQPEPEPPRQRQEDGPKS